MMAEYYHGVRVIEEATEALEKAAGTAGLQAVWGTAPVNLAADPYGATNVPIACGSMQEAREKLGYSGDFASYTLCQAMHASFEMTGVPCVIFFNVLDPKRHKKDNPEKEYPVSGGQAVLGEDGILLDTIRITAGGETLEAGTDYITAFRADGKAVATMLSDKGMAAGAIKATSTSIDPLAVTGADIIGGYNAQTGKESGFEAIRQAYPRTGMVPSLLLAPGWSHKPDVAAALITKCTGINGVFTAECVLDIDTASAKKYTDVKKAKDDNGYSDPHAIAVWPKAKAGGKSIYYSAIYAAAAACSDAQNDDVPSISPSNKLVGITSAALEDGTEVYIDRQQANSLNAAGIVTLINEAGWRTWGNNTSAYPETEDTKERWICCRRMFDWISNSLIRTYHEKVDSPANFRLVESICDSENIRLSSYAEAGKLAAGKITYNNGENKAADVMAGKVTFRISVAVYTPAEDITFILKFDPKMLEESLAGGDA